MSVPTPQTDTRSCRHPATGPLARYLAHPGAETARLLHHLGALAAHLGVTAGPAVVAGIALVAAVTVAVVRRRQAAPAGRRALAWCRCSPHPRSTPKERPPCGPTWWRCCARPGGGRSAASRIWRSSSPPATPA